ncbi:uncharacterized protein LOC116105377 [Pistacia vera]|uniref:uncharacterized protein LOC116105377 n=1 Tax=Pistacia vera TaxID=55513 RepID=UPI0012633E07|nr:uncharacterized protein LOC116105377 [Pistacia vera]
MDDFQHSGETISRYVGKVCNAICGLQTEFMKAPDFSEVPEEMSTNPKYYPFFKNVMAVCNFKMMFTYVITGWEGSAHDSKVLNSVLGDPDSGFPHPPPGKYYLVNAGYANRRGFLAPHRRVPCHLHDHRHN